MWQFQKEVRRLLIAVNRIDGLYYQQAKKMGVKDNLLTVLYALSNGEEYSQKRVSEEWLIPRTTVNTVVKEAVKEGYISLTHNEHTKEKGMLITEKGKKYELEMQKCLYESEHEAMKKVIDEYGPEFVSALELYADGLQECFLSENIIEKKESIKEDNV